MNKSIKKSVAEFYVSVRDNEYLFTSIIKDGQHTVPSVDNIKTSEFAFSAHYEIKDELGQRCVKITTAERYLRKFRAQDRRRALKSMPYLTVEQLA